MANVGYLASALVTGALVVAVVLALVWRVEWRGYSPTLEAGPGASSGGVRAVLESPAAWSVAFLVVTLGSAGGAVLFVQTGATATLAAVARAALGLLFAVVAGYLLFGTYATARSHGFARSQSAAMGAWIGGMLLIGAIVANLLFAA
jgi:hypothetical protein